MTSVDKQLFDRQADPVHATTALWPRWLAGTLVVSTVLLQAWSFRQHTLPAARRRATIDQLVPGPRADQLFVSSDQCRACHPDQHASWHASYHRTMTQTADPDTVLGSFDGTTVQVCGLDYRVVRDAEGLWAEMPDPDEMMEVVMLHKPKAVSDIPRVRLPVVMTTGSHHYQTYWVSSPRFQSLLQTLPLVYLKEDQRWIPRSDAFLQPPPRQPLVTQWNHHCIKCHSTGGVPGLDARQPVERQLNTKVGQLGISCEACHGPGQQHVQHYQNPWYRYRMHLTDQHDATIVNPARLDHERSSQVCGQCHGVFLRDEQHGREFAEHGASYRPGDDLHRDRYYIEFPRVGGPQEHWEDYRNNRDFFRQVWWDDGTMLAAGREYTAMKASGCYLRGDISCLSCHSMHESDPDDQLRRDLQGDSVCLACHDQPQYTAQLASHTHHQSGSTGSSCLNCHMPYTSYALLNAIRNHQISVPDVRASVVYGTPNACNLCHLDRTLEWSQQAMSDWYGTEPATLSDEQREFAAATLWLLKGHAAQRVIAAWHMGWEPALEASGRQWQQPLLARLLSDPYGVVRYIANRSLCQATGRTWDYDFQGTDEQREAIAERVRSLSSPLPEGAPRPARLFRSDGRQDEQVIGALLRERDDRPVTIQE